jgi:hypothetical protein
MIIMYNSEICKNALQGSIYSHKLSDDAPLENLEVDSYDYDKIKEFVKNSIILLNYNTTHRPVIIEILNILGKNSDEFIIDKYKYIGFYWNGIPILRIKQSKNDTNDRELHVSIHRYNKEKNSLISEKKTNKIITFGICASIIIAGIITLMTCIKKYKPDKKNDKFTSTFL